MPTIVFLDATIFLDNAPPARVSVGSEVAQGADWRVSHGAPTRSAEPLNRLCREAGASIVFTESWGLKDAREALVACGVTAPFHPHFKVPERAPAQVGLIGGTEYHGLSPAEMSAQPANVISFAPETPPTAALHWMRQHGAGAQAIVIGRPGTRVDVPGAIKVALPIGAVLTDAIVDRILAVVAKAAA